MFPRLAGQTGRPITITVCASGKIARGLNSSGTQGSNRGLSQRATGAKPTRGISRASHFFVIFAFRARLIFLRRVEPAIKGCEDRNLIACMDMLSCTVKDQIVRQPMRFPCHLKYTNPAMTYDGDMNLVYGLRRVAMKMGYFIPPSPSI